MATPWIQVYPPRVQRYCEGCRRFHELVAFDLDQGEMAPACRAHVRAMARATRRETRRRQQSRLEALEKRRRSLIVALMKIDQEIASERGLLSPQQELEAARNLEPDCDYGAVGAGRYCAEIEGTVDVFEADGDPEAGD